MRKSNVDTAELSEESKLIGRPKKYTLEEIEDALRGNRGLLSDAAKSLGASRHTIARYVAENPSLQEAIHEAREATIDFAENALHAAIERKELGAIIFYLKTQAKSRGYIERSERINVSIDIALLQKFENAATTAGLQPSQIIEALIEQVSNAAPPMLPSGDTDTTEAENRT